MFLRRKKIQMSDTIAAIATGNTVSAIGIIRISGPEAISAASKLFKPMPKENRKLAYGELRSAEGELLDLCLCTISHAPDSYTGEDTAEFQCHGSPIVLRTVLDELFKIGVRQAKPGEFTKRAFLNGKMELVNAEAVADLIDSETAEQAKNAASQLSGAISTKIDVIYSELTDVCSHFHAVLDYPDEDIEDFIITDYRNKLSSHIKTLETLLATVKSGEIMKEGIPTAIVGKPNSGKSSLLNALLGYDRAIVTSVPGTTRDTIEEKIKIDHLLLRLIDTAGIRETDDEAEKLGVERSRCAIENAQLVINIIDGTSNDEPVSDNSLVVYNKMDLPDFRGGEINISARTGEGLDTLKNKIIELFPQSDVPSGEILTNSRHVEAVKTALEYLYASIDALSNQVTPDIVLTEVEGAMNAIGELSGKTVKEDVTNRIFARFCVGK